MRAFCYHFFRLVTKLLCAPLVSIHVLRPQYARRGGAWILAANHISHFDPPIIGSIIRRKIDWMGMAELFANPLLGAWFRAIDTFPVDRSHLDRQAVRSALARLRAGRAIGMFPEGGIRDGERSVLEGAPVRPGVAGLSQMTNAPIIPCVIMGTDRCYNLPHLWRPGRRIPVWIAFGEPLVPGDAPDRATARAQLEGKMAQAFHDLAQEMRQHFHLREEDLPKAPASRLAESRHFLP